MKIVDGYFIFHKGEASGFRVPGYNASYFDTGEFECHCDYVECREGEQRVSVELLRRLCEVRERLQLPIIVRSGYRCHQHQEALRAKGLNTAKGKSSHELGHAADCMPKEPEVSRPGKGTMKRFLALCAGQFKAIGVAATYLHVDIRDDKERRWSY